MATYYNETQYKKNNHVWEHDILDGSLFVKHYCQLGPDASRKPIISAEMFDHSKDNLIGLTLVDKSLYFLFPLTYPEIYESAAAANRDVLSKLFRSYWRYIAETATNVDGFQDSQLDMQEAQFKNNFFNMPLVTTVQTPTKEITLSIPSELEGYFITNMTRHWVNAISDENSRFAHYNGTGQRFNNWSHSASMAYIKPNKTLTEVSYAAFFFMMIPKTVPMSSFNGDSLSPGILTLNLPFSVNMVDTRNVKVRETAKTILNKYRDLIVVDNSTYGMLKGTALGMFNDVNIDRVFNEYRMMR